MRQIYNMNESGCMEEEELTPLILAPPPAVAASGQAGQDKQDILQCISACAQQTRLSLANLLPSRFVIGTSRRKCTTAGFRDAHKHCFLCESDFCFFFYAGLSRSLGTHALPSHARILSQLLILLGINDCYLKRMWITTIIFVTDEVFVYLLVPCLFQKNSCCYNFLIVSCLWSDLKLSKIPTQLAYRCFRDNLLKINAFSFSFCFLNQD